MLYLICIYALSNLLSSNRKKIGGKFIGSLVKVTIKRSVKFYKSNSHNIKSNPTICLLSTTDGLLNFFHTEYILKTLSTESSCVERKCIN